MLQKYADEIKQTNLTTLFQQDPQRGLRYAQDISGLYVNYAKHWITDPIMAELYALADKRQLKQAIEQMFDGVAINASENQPALHTALRNSHKTTPLLFQGTDMRPLIKAELQKMADWVARIHQKKWMGSTSAPIEHVIHIGIGGSDLGPQLVIEALKPYQVSAAPKIYFVSNLDGSEWNDAIEYCDPAKTLIVVASKSFNTPESLLNAQTAIEWLKAAGLDHKQHLVAITAQKERAIAYGILPDHILSIWPWVGGRYSLWSTMGFSIALSIGMQGFEQLLQGAAATDEHFLTQPFEKNIPVILGLLTVWYRSYHDVHSEVLLPYAQRLAKFPSYLQQLDMESCGKSYTTEGTFAKATGLAVWGQTGTPAQHAFNQWLHQGTDTVLTDFILIAQSAEKESPHHQHLLANALAQSQALMDGRAAPNAPQHIPGNRPSTLIVLPTLSPYYLGSLLALYEHKVFVQSICWQINPFDQFGVELGKKLTQDILPYLEAKTPLGQSLDSATAATIDILKKV